MAKIVLAELQCGPKANKCETSQDLCSRLKILISFCYLTINWRLLSLLRHIMTNECLATLSYWPGACGGSAVLCVEFVLCCMQMWILEFRYPRQTLRKRALYFRHAIQKVNLSSRYRSESKLIKSYSQCASSQILVTTAYRVMSGSFIFVVEWFQVNISARVSDSDERRSYSMQSFRCENGTRTGCEWNYPKNLRSFHTLRF